MKGYNGLYLVGNYPDESLFIKTAVLGLKKFNFLEIGIPFTDPVADGPVIAKAADETINKGYTLNRLIDSIKEIKKSAGKRKKIYFMTYANIVYSMGIEKFSSLCAETGIDGAIIPDVPFIESGRFKKIFRRNKLKFIHFITPENTDSQIKEIAKAARGFLYFVSIRGITGSKLAIDNETAAKIALAKKHSRVPVVLGFGIKDSGTAKIALDHADGFIIGTKIVEVIGSGDMDKVREFFDGLDGV
jgi:tryptophan synthase alpha chain